ncbi:GNAT family N-acetyltransferase [Lentilactobacillus sp. Marseille-Q4993]|uniref:GNAT family N-acetyltransferase n=1 Tax=Lentilactobacillus sp. Marseille-Q4993 TaxID=3039492 RepID=UPI0024BD0629|nr:GNAT family N-acetyltransferase [Lentilactobacillus sp. Marseille-Q4993]
MIKIIPATIDDLPFITDVYNESVPTRMATADVDKVTVEQRQPWFDSHNPQTRPILLIKVDDEPAGWISLNDYYERQGYRRTAEVSIYLDQKFQGQGLGSAALKYVDEHAKDYDINTVVSLIFSHNQPSKKLFEKFDYKLWGHLPDVVEMDAKKYSLDIYGKHIN